LDDIHNLATQMDGHILDTVILCVGDILSTVFVGLPWGLVTSLLTLIYLYGIHLRDPVQDCVTQLTKEM